MAQKPIFQFFGIKFNFNRIKSPFVIKENDDNDDMKFRYVKPSSGKVVEQSISYEITEKYRMERVSFHLKYWLKLTYPLLHSAAELRHVQFSVDHLVAFYLTLVVLCNNTGRKYTAFISVYTLSAHTCTVCMLTYLSDTDTVGWLLETRLIILLKNSV